MRKIFHFQQLFSTFVLYFRNTCNEVCFVVTRQKIHSYRLLFIVCIASSGGGDYSLVTGASSPYAHPDDSCPCRHPPPRLSVMMRWIIGVAATGLGFGVLVVPLATLLSRRRAGDAADGSDQLIVPCEGEQEEGERQSTPSVLQVQALNRVAAVLAWISLFFMEF